MRNQTFTIFLSVFEPPVFCLNTIWVIQLVCVDFSEKVIIKFSLSFLVTVTNISIVIFVVVCGCFKVDFNNWSLPAENVPAEAGKGGFFPFGAAGVFKGAAICFYAFIGFDVIATAGEEAKNPKRSIPISICLSLFIIFLAYFSVSSILTLMIPYHAQVRNFSTTHFGIA